MTRAKALSGIDPSSKETTYLVLAVAEPAGALSRLLDNAYEGDGAYFLSLTDAWAVRDVCEGFVAVRVERLCGDDVEVVAKASCEAPSEPLAPTTLVVVSDTDWDSIAQSLMAQELVPVIVGPKPEQP